MAEGLPAIIHDAVLLLSPATGNDAETLGAQHTLAAIRLNHFCLNSLNGRIC
jgi:hypothetical protein